MTQGLVVWALSVRHHDVCLSVTDSLDLILRVGLCEKVALESNSLQISTGALKMDKTPVQIYSTESLKKPQGLIVWIKIGIFIHLFERDIDDEQTI